MSTIKAGKREKYSQPNGWSEEEIRLLNSDLSGKEIAAKIGRSPAAIYKKRSMLKRDQG